MLTYKGYTGVLEVDTEAGELFGRVVGTRDVITFVGASVEEACRSFEETIDAYLTSCAEEGREPDRPYSGRFNVRIDPDLHRKVAALAKSRDTSVDDVVADSLATTVGETAPVKPEEPPWQEVKAAIQERRDRQRSPSPQQGRKTLDKQGRQKRIP
jgi:predicted HicB family RNase H-like nuclease